ncbi:hypothetical protein OBBRIDRAFT_787084 [Obba rivulosa]|uniref:Uncharacterized protein n=1 Tax=Obba rivulosa TaxID=1052685 RepID=A0A8E2J766_9APHY|nr:hypothetical protein OBBRIDRAFT_787084 [Obba rivulosa]
MIMGSSTAPYPLQSQPWQSSSSATPSTNLDLSAATPATTTVHDVQIVPLVAPTPSCSPTPNVVVIDLYTTLTIPDYSLYYSTPIESFRPTFLALPDGSLISQPFIADQKWSNAWLFVYGSLTMLFLYNSVIAGSYIRRVKVKNKSLFWLLFVSQILALAAPVSEVVGAFDFTASCTTVGVTRKIALMSSYSLLMTGVLGFKAYRCLSDTRVVPAILAPLRLAMLCLLGITLSRYRGVRGLSGGCEDGAPSKLLLVVIILQCVESLFICGCFCYAYYTSSRTPADQARLSIRTSAEDRPDSGMPPNKETTEPNPPRRGWWDYVPDGSPYQLPLQPINLMPQGAWQRFSIWMREIQYWRSSPPNYAFQRKPSLPGIHPIPQPPRPPSNASSNTLPSPVARSRSQDAGLAYDPTSPPSVSAIRRFIEKVPRMASFRQMLRNELFFTALITGFYMVVSVIMVVGIHKDIYLTSEGWILLDWVLISLLTMYSFNRVVRRNEEEAILQHPSAWDPIYRAELEAAKAFRQTSARRAWSPVSVVTQWRPRRRDGSTSNPFGSTRATERPLDHVSSLQLGSRSFSLSRRFSSSTTTSYLSSEDPTVDSIRRASRWDSAVVLPSPDLGDYSCSDVSTPLSDSEGIVRRPATAPAASWSRRDEGRRTSSQLEGDWKPPDPRYYHSENLT